MLGHRLWLSLSKNHDVWATARSREKVNFLMREFSIDPDKLIGGIKVDDISTIEATISKLKPDLVLNCVGVIKQKKEEYNPISSVRINSLFPHELAAICFRNESRMIHFSTDCVYSGLKGGYREEDTADSSDLYGRSKLLGEVNYLENVLTIRTSIIGREIYYGGGLIEWFLNQEDEPVNGFSNAFFSGLPTSFLAEVIEEYVIPRKDLNGVYNISVDPIDKYSLLELTKKVFKKKISINKCEDFHIDRSLCSERFRSLTGWSPPSWENLIGKLNVDEDFYKSINL